MYIHYIESVGAYPVDVTISKGYVFSGRVAVAVCVCACVSGSARMLLLVRLVFRDWVVSEIVRRLEKLVKRGFRLSCRVSSCLRIELVALDINILIKRILKLVFFLWEILITS